MKSEESVWIDVALLRVGHYVELDVGWMAHPFPTGSFKITSPKQIEVIKGLGKKQVRVVPRKSDEPSSEAADVPSESATPIPPEAASLLTQEQADAEQRRLRAAMLTAQERSLIACERRFAESVRLYRKTMDMVQSQPKLATEPCLGMVNTYVTELMDNGEAAIRLLSEAAGDKSAMHPVNVTVISLLLGKAMGLNKAELIDLARASLLHAVG